MPYLFVAIYVKPNSLCNLFFSVLTHLIFCALVVCSHSLSCLFSPFPFLPFCFLTSCFLSLQKSGPIYPDFPMSLKIFLGPSSSIFHLSLIIHVHLFLSLSLSVRLVEGQWLEWGPWSKCSVTCNTGSQQRQRRCSASVHGWAECKGPHQESRECINPSCSGKAHK